MNKRSSGAVAQFAPKAGTFSADGLRNRRAYGSPGHFVR